MAARADPSRPPRAGARGRAAARCGLALIVVAILSAGALFLSGYTLGTQRSLTPGTPPDQQQLFAPYWEAYDKIAVVLRRRRSAPSRWSKARSRACSRPLDDPFSSYMTSEEYQASLSGISGEFEGIGAEMASVDSGGQAVHAAGTGVPARGRARSSATHRREQAGPAGRRRHQRRRRRRRWPGMSIDDVVDEGPRRRGSAR